MKQNNSLVPFGFFALALLLSIIAGPASSRFALRAADEVTGPGHPPPCAQWHLNKHVGEADKWKLTVKELASTLSNSEDVFAEEFTFVTLTATVTYRDAAGALQPPVQLPFTIQVGSTAKNWKVGMRAWDLARQHIQLPALEAQSRKQWRANVGATDLLGNPLPGAAPAGSRLDSLTITGPQMLKFTTEGSVFCKVSKVFGAYTPRPLDYDVDGAGNGGGVN